jgi:hypothetical protein
LVPIKVKFNWKVNPGDKGGLTCFFSVRHAHYSFWY